MCRTESLTLLSELYSLAYPDCLPASVGTLCVDLTDDDGDAAGTLKDSDEHKQARLEAFMKHHGIEHHPDRSQKSASN